VIVSTRIDNLSDVPLTSLSVIVVTNQPNLSVSATLDTNSLAGFASANLSIRIGASDATIVQSPVVLRVTSAEGVMAELTVIVRVEALQPRLTPSPSSLIAAMLRGAQTPIALTIANQGGIATGPLEV